MVMFCFVCVLFELLNFNFFFSIESNKPPNALTAPAPMDNIDPATRPVSVKGNNPSTPLYRVPTYNLVVRSRRLPHPHRHARRRRPGRRSATALAPGRSAPLALLAASHHAAATR